MKAPAPAAAASPPVDPAALQKAMKAAKAKNACNLQTLVKVAENEKERARAASDKAAQLEAELAQFRGKGDMLEEFETKHHEMVQEQREANRQILQEFREANKQNQTFQNKVLENLSASGARTDMLIEIMCMVMTTVGGLLQQGETEDLHAVTSRQI
jgi:hypothetical protein